MKNQTKLCLQNIHVKYKDIDLKHKDKKRCAIQSLAKRKPEYLSWYQTAFIKRNIITNSDEGVSSPKHIKQKLIGLEEINRFQSVIEDVNTQQLLEQVDRKINKGIDDLNNAINYLDLIDIYRILHPRMLLEKNIFFSSAHWHSRR